MRLPSFGLLRLGRKSFRCTLVIDKALKRSKEVPLILKGSSSIEVCATRCPKFRLSYHCLIFLDGVSEGQFRHVLDEGMCLIAHELLSSILLQNCTELPMIQSELSEHASYLADILKHFAGACAELNINPKITLIVVGKRHHNQ